MDCPKCEKEMKETWCDDDIHIPGILYECPNKHLWFEDEGVGILEVNAKGKIKY